MKNLIFILFFLLVHSCINKPNSKLSFSAGRPCYEISYEDLINNKHVTGLSQLALNVDYIQLETNKDCIIGHNPEYFFTDSLIFISNTNHILKYSRNGKFLKRIGNPGRGPGKIDNIKTMSIIPNKKLIVIQESTENKLLYFTFDGKLIKTVSIPPFENLKVLNDERFIAYQSGLTGQEKYIFELTNEKRDTISVVHNNDMWKNSSGKAIESNPPPFEPFYFYRNMCYLKSMYNDTVYYILKNKIEPRFFINMGKYKLPPELRYEKICLSSEKTELYLKKTSEYFYCNVFGAAYKKFITASNFMHGDFKYCLYDDFNHNGYLLINENNESTGFVNDWDGGPDFWPIGNVNDDQVFMPVDKINLRKSLDKLKTGKASIKNPEQQKKVMNMISGRDASDNPVLMVVTLSRSLKDFTGKWALNESKSTPFSGIHDSAFIFTEVNGLTIGIKTAALDGNFITRPIHYMPGGAFGTLSPTRERKIVSSWNTDRKGFTEIETISDCKKGIKKKKVYEKITVFSLSDDGKTLIIKTDETLSNEPNKSENEKHSLRVYSKQ
jgi:hypothetical protein